jgi:hypothetical protein
VVQAVQSVKTIKEKDDSRFDGTRDCASRSNVPIVQIVPERFDRLERLTCLNFLMSFTTRRMTPRFLLLKIFSVVNRAT